MTLKFLLGIVHYYQVIQKMVLGFYHNTQPY